MDLQKIFSSVPDFRVQGRIRHLLSEILIISLCAVLSGAEDFEEIAEYGRQKEDFLRQFLVLPNGIPSHDTFNRVFRYLDVSAFETCLVKWSKEIIDQLTDYQVTIDGKVLRATGEQGKRTAGLCLVSAWVSQHCLSLGQVKVEQKSNEKAAIPNLLKDLEIAGSLVSIDAMGSDRKIAGKIRQKQADYLLALKENNKGLYEEVHDWMVNRTASFEKATQVDLVGGRIEQRTTYVCDYLEFIDELKNWQDAQSVIMVESRRTFKKEPDKETFKRRFYVSSKKESAVYFNDCIRHHWSIENQLHWYLDVVFREDQQRVKQDNAPENMAILRKMALHLLLKNKGKDSLKKVRKRVAWNELALISVLQTLF